MAFPRQGSHLSAWVAFPRQGAYSKRLGKVSATGVHLNTCVAFPRQGSHSEHVDPSLIFCVISRAAIELVGQDR